MTNQHNTPAGWYYMQGDPPGTQRWWDGGQWTGEPHQAAQAPAQPTAVPTQVPAPLEQPIMQVQQPAMEQPAMQVQQPVAAAAVAEPAAVEYGSMLTSDLDAYWASMEDPVDPAAEFADASSWSQDPGDGEGGDPSEFPQRPPDTNEGGGGSTSPIAWALLPFKNFANFKGRSCRAEYWWFTLLNILVSMMFFAGLVLTAPSADTVAPGDDLPPAMMLVFGAMLIYSLIVTIPSWAVAVRRLHDTNRSGWSMLISLIPFIGGLWLLIIYVTPGSGGWNKYGDDHLRP